jgi:Flp pilus assembly pilin Flp
MWHETDGVLSFEWTMLTSLLTVGVVSGVAAVRDAVTDEMGDLAQAMVSLDQSYVIEQPLVIRVHTLGGGFGGGSGVNSAFGGQFLGGQLPSGASGSAFIDASSYDDCYRGGMKVIEFPRNRDRQPSSPAANAQSEANPQPAAEETAPAL